MNAKQIAKAFASFNDRAACRYRRGRASPDHRYRYRDDWYVFGLATEEERGRLDILPWRYLSRSPAYWLRQLRYGERVLIRRRPEGRGSRIGGVFGLELCRITKLPAAEPPQPDERNKS